MIVDRLRAGHLSFGGARVERSPHRRRRRSGVALEIQRGHPSGVRGRHRGATDRVGRRTAGLPRRRDTDTRGEPIHAVSVVRPRCLLVGLVGRADRHRGGHPRGTVLAGVLGDAALVAVSRGDGRGHASSDHVLHSVVHRAVAAAAERQVGHGGPQPVCRDPVDSRDHSTPSAGAAAVENAHCDELHSLGDPIFGAPDRAGDVGAVTVAIARPSRRPRRRSRSSRVLPLNSLWLKRMPVSMM